MTMKKYLWILIPLLFVGCQRRENGQPPRMSGMPGLSTGTTTKYAGALTDTQTTYVPVNTVLFSGDYSYPYICIGVVCDVDHLPAQTCTEAGSALGYAPGWQAQVQCYTTIPTPFIIWGPDTNTGKSKVGFVHNPFHEGYTSYAIKTIVLD
jgi:hypothetical protein